MAVKKERNQGGRNKEIVEAGGRVGTVERETTAGWVQSTKGAH